MTKPRMFVSKLMIVIVLMSANAWARPASALFSAQWQKRITEISGMQSYCEATADPRCEKGGRFYRFVLRFVASYRRACVLPSSGVTAPPARRKLPTTDGVTGCCNIAIGPGAAIHLTTGNHNACIGRETCPSLTVEDGVTEVRLTQRPGQGAR